MGRARARAVRFLEEFAVPLLAGGETRVGAPLGPAELEELALVLARPDEPDTTGAPRAIAAIAGARRALAAPLELAPGTFVLDEGALRLLVASYDLLFLLHPEAGELLLARRPLDRLAAFALDCAGLPPPATAAEAIARHTVVGPLWRLWREDVHLRFWAGERIFRGQPPPRRLIALPGLRRVRTEVRRATPFATPALGGRTRPLLARLLGASPLTALLEPLREEPRLALIAAAPCLTDRGLARAVVERYLTLGLERVGGPLAAAVARAAGEPGGGPVARIGLQLIVHLHHCALLGDAAAGRPAAAPSPLIARATAAPATRELQDFFGIFAVAEELAPALVPPGAPPRDLAARVELHRREAAALCPPARRRALIEHYRRATGDPTGRRAAER